MPIMQCSLVGLAGTKLGPLRQELCRCTEGTSAGIIEKFSQEIKGGVTVRTLGVRCGVSRQSDGIKGRHSVPSRECCCEIVNYLNQLKVLLLAQRISG
jgi:hypothetical protein